jgi:hypothetical protein
MIPLLLWALATLDAAFIGYRDAAGRNALINKGAYNRHAMIRGALFGQAAVAIAGIVIAALVLLSSQPAEQFRQFQEAGSRMLIVYLPYTLILLIAFALRAIPSVDLRSLTSVLIFGPFTLIRPIIVVCGVAWGFLAAPGFITLLLGMLILTLMLGLGRLLDRLNFSEPNFPKPVSDQVRIL